MQLEVEAARVAHGLALHVAAPQRRGGRVAVGARHAGPLGAHLRKGRALERASAGELATGAARVRLAGQAMGGLEACGWREAAAVPLSSVCSRGWWRRLAASARGRAARESAARFRYTGSLCSNPRPAASSPRPLQPTLIVTRARTSGRGRERTRGGRGSSGREAQGEGRGARAGERCEWCVRRAARAARAMRCADVPAAAAASEGGSCRSSCCRARTRCRGSGRCRRGATAACGWLRSSRTRVPP